MRETTIGDLLETCKAQHIHKTNDYFEIHFICPCNDSLTTVSNCEEHCEHYYHCNNIAYTLDAEMVLNDEKDIKEFE